MISQKSLSAPMLPDQIRKTIKAYEDHAETYANYHVQSIPQFEIAKFMAAMPKKARILVIGPGLGRDADFFAREGLNVVGIDLSQKMLKLWEKRIVKKNRRFVRANALCMPFREKSFDGIWCMGTCAHWKNDEVKTALVFFWNLLKKRGVLCADVPVGDGEHWVKSIEVGNEKRFFSFWNQLDWEEALRDAGFEFMASFEMELDEEYVWLTSFARKR